MKHLTLIPTFIATLITPSLSYSQDELRTLPSGRWFNERDKGGLYLATNDYFFGAKPVRWQCGSANASGGTSTISDISGLLVVMAHQPDFPQRMVFFGEINRAYNAAVQAGNSDWVIRGAPIPEFQPSQSTRQYRYANKYHTIEKDAIYASLLVYVYGKINNQNPSVWVPLVAYYSGDDKNLDALEYYALDCAAGNLNAIGNRYKNLAVVAPLGRADDYPAFRITVLDGGNDHYRQTWASVAVALSPWIDNHDGSYINDDGSYSIDKIYSIRRLLLHNLNPAQDTRLTPVPLDINSSSNWTYGQLLRQYFDHHDGNGDRVNPPFLSGLDFPIKIDALAPSNGNPWFAANTINTEPSALQFSSSIPSAPANASNANKKPPQDEASLDTITPDSEDASVSHSANAEALNKIDKLTQATLILQFTGEAFAELASRDWSNKIQTNSECEVRKLAANSAQYQLICQDDTKIRADSRIFLGKASEPPASWWLVKDKLDSNIDSTGTTNIIDASEAIVDQATLAAITIKYQGPSSGWLANNAFNSTNLSQIFPNASYKLSDLANAGFGADDCTVPVAVKASDIINRSITIDFSACQVRRTISIAYPKLYQPAELQRMQVSTTFSGCPEINATYLQAQEGWRFANCFLEANSPNTFPIQIAILGFESVEHSFTITPANIEIQASEIALRLEEQLIATKLRPQLVTSAIQPFGPDLNPIPNYRLAQVSYRSFINDTNTTCPPTSMIEDGNNLTLPSLSEANCPSILPTHISYHYQRLDSNASSAPPNEAYRSNWRTPYFILGETFTYSHDQFKRRALFSSASLRQQIEFLQGTHLGAQYDENDNLNGKWAYLIHADADCSQPIGLINSAADFIGIDNYDARWPLYAQIANIDDIGQSLSNCAPAQFEPGPEDDSSSIVTFELFLPIPR